MRTCHQNDLTTPIAATHEPCRYEVLCLPFELPLLPPAKGQTCGQMHLPADPNRMLSSQTCVLLALVHVHYNTLTPMVFDCATLGKHAGLVAASTTRVYPAAALAYGGATPDPDMGTDAP